MNQQKQCSEYYKRDQKNKKQRRINYQNYMRPSSLNSSVIPHVLQLLGQIGCTNGQKIKQKVDYKSDIKLT